MQTLSYAVELGSALLKSIPLALCDIRCSLPSSFSDGKILTVFSRQVMLMGGVFKVTNPKCNLTSYGDQDSSELTILKVFCAFSSAYHYHVLQSERFQSLISCIITENDHLAGVFLPKTTADLILRRIS